MQLVRFEVARTKLTRATFPLMPKKMRSDQAPKPTEEEPESRLSPEIKCSYELLRGVAVRTKAEKLQFFEADK